MEEEFTVAIYQNEKFMFLSAKRMAVCRLIMPFIRH